jgi:hypothetical protein
LLKIACGSIFELSSWQSGYEEIFTIKITTQQDLDSRPVSLSGPAQLPYKQPLNKAMLHGAIFLATCNAILLLRDVKLPNTSLYYTPLLMFSQHIENSSLISLN